MQIPDGYTLDATATQPSIYNDELPLSFAQQRLWFLSQMEGVSEAYHIPLGLRLSGTLDRIALHRALDQILTRHEVLRTTFAFVDGEPVQRIATAQGTHFLLIEHDLSRHGDHDKELDRLIALEATSSFDLEAGPLIRGRLIRMNEDEHALLITMHHIVSDGWSMGIFTSELSTLYAAFREGKPDPLAELDIQYADYAVWQRQWIEGDILRQQAEYWKTTLNGAPALLELPADHPRPAQQDFAGAFVELILDQQLTIALKELSRQHGCTLFMTLLTAWAVLLARLSGQQDLIIGTPTANRGRSEIENLIGFFVNTLALRIDLSGSPSTGQLLERVKAQTLAAQQHQDIPFEQVVELAQPVRSLAHNPLVQIMFAWQNADNDSRLELPGLELAALPPSPHRVAKFDLTLSLMETGNSIAGGVEYATSLFDQATIERYLGYFRTLLEAMVADDTQAVDRLTILDEAERHQLLYGWNDTRTEFPADKCVHQLFEEQVERSPDAVAVVFEEDSLSYAELNARANRLAHYLQELGVKPDDRVALCVDRSLEMVVALLAVLKAGGAYVPLDPAYPPERLQFMLRDADPVALLTHSHLHNLLADMTPGLPVLLLDAPLWQDRVSDNPGPQNGLTSRHLAYVIYTSGSTGQPKGVMVEHAQIARLFSATQSWFQFAESDVWTLFHSYAFDFSVWELWGALLYGGRLIVVSMETAHSPKDFYDLVCREKVTILNHTPSAFRQLSATQAEIRQEHSLRRVIFGGEALEVSTLAPWYKQNRNQHTVLVNMYGITETTVHVTYRELEQTDTLRLNSGSPVGRRIPDLRIYILDGTGQPVPVGVSGELYIGGAGVARGYLNRAELTAERFLSDPFSDESGARMYRTGDLGRWLPDGNIEFLGRNDFQVKIRGFRIELGEIEARLREHPALRDAVVVAREDTPGDKRLIAYYTGDQTDSEELRTHLAASLPDYMVPAAYVHLDALPLTPNGKLDRRALPEPGSDAFASRDYEPPQGEIEIRLAAIWSEVLRLERIGRHDNFFALGGHSLLAVTLIERMRRSGIKADVHAVFLAPTVAQLAAMAAAVDTGVPSVTVPPNLIPEDCEAVLPQMLPLIQLSAEEIDRIVAMVPGGAANVQDIYPLAPLQEGILFHHLMSGESDPYLLATELSFDSRERLDNYVAALQAVIKRHDTLRTAVLWEGLAEPVQVVWRRATLHIEEIALDPAAGDVAAQLYARFDPRHFRIDVRQAPLLRLYIAYDQAKDRWLMMQLLHHLVDDNTSLRGLLAEVQAHLLGETEQLPGAIPFRNLVAQARLGISAQEHEAFFRQMLADVDEPMVPFGLVDVQGDGSGIEEARLDLDADLGQRLRTNARRLGVSAASLFHVAWARVLAKISGREDVVFGTVLFGRMQGGEGADRVLGLFINTLPLRIQIGDEGVEAAVRRTHILLADLLRHEHASLALAQRCSAVPAPAPLFSALLNYRHNPGGAQAPSARTVQAWEGIQGLRGEERTNYPFTLSVNDLGGSFSLDAQMPASVGPMRICWFMHIALQSVAEALETAPARAVRTLEVLPAAERHLVLYGWNDTKAEFPAEKCIHQLFEEQVEKTPHGVAVVFEDRSLSYGELNARANQLAHYLRELGVRPDDRVAICLERGLEMIVALMAVLKAGGAYVPLDPAYPEERLNFMLQDSGPRALLTQSQLIALLAEAAETLPVLDLGAAAPPWDALPLTNPDSLDVGLTSLHLAYVIYTSGSTGTPKGVMVPHVALVNFLSSMQTKLSITSEDKLLAVTTLTFDIATLELYLPLTVGALVRISSRETSRDGACLLKELRLGITVMQATPATWQMLLDSGWEGAKSLKALCGGETMSTRLAASLLARTTSVWNMYGPTETSVWSLLEKLDHIADRIPIGRPIANTQIYILDRYGEPVPIGVTGELYIGGAGVARGYLNRAALTAERFLPDPFSDESGARMYRTGDLGRWLPDGNIEFLGRNDFQVKIRGFRIELGEIEARLREHEGVRDAAVIAREDTAGDRRLVAYLVPDMKSIQLNHSEAPETNTEQWQALWDEAYSQIPPPDETAPNLAGWNSSYTRQPIPADAMQEQIASTVDRLLAFKPKTALEIGCGTGLLLFNIAPSCERYVATDFSHNVIQLLQGQVKARNLSQVELHESSADQFDRSILGPFDLVIFNSIIQYFPDVEYLVRVLDKAVTMLGNGGVIQVGDVRNLALLEAHHLSVQNFQSPDTLPVERFAKQVRDRISNEKELLIHPSFFSALKERYARLGHITIQLRRGRHRNELTCFRYDAFLHFDVTAQQGRATTVNWLSHRFGLAYLNKLLRDETYDNLHVTNVPNARVMEEVLSCHTLSSMASSASHTVGTLRNAVSAALSENVIDPEDLWALGEKAGYETIVSWSMDVTKVAYCDVSFRRKPPVYESLLRTPSDPVGTASLATYGNNPLKSKSSGSLISQIRTALRKHLPEYMVPAVYVHLDALPLTPNGKLDRRALPVPGTNAFSTNEYSAPQGEVEEKLAAVWAEVLKLERVGRRDNFFSLGGHSLLAVRVVVRLRQIFALEVTIRDLFEHPVLCDLAHALQSAAHAEVSHIAHVKREEDRICLSFAQQRLWFLSQMEGVSEAYHIPLGLRLSGTLDRIALHRALDQILTRHEVLRTTFAFVDGEPVQRIATAQGTHFLLIEHDLSRHGDHDKELDRLIALEATSSFDLEAGPLIRGRLIRMNEDEHALLITMHHIVSDGWSMGIFTSELSTLYAAFREGKPDPLAELDIQYADYAVWQRQWIEGDILRQQAEYWKTTLNGAPALLELPADHPRPAQQDFAGAFVELILDQQLTIALKELSRQHGCTLFMTLLTAWAVLLARLSGQQDLIIGTPTANRGRSEIENLIGFFVNTLALRIDLSGSPSTGQLLERVKAQTLAAQQHQDIPFEQVVELAQPVRSLAHSPLFQVMVAWQSNDTEPPRLPGLEIAPLQAGSSVKAKFDLTLSLGESDGRIAGVIEYAVALFDRQTIERYLGYFRTLLEAMVADDTQAVDRLTILDEAERHQLLYGWNDTRTEFPADKCVHQLFEEQVERSPDAVAVVFEEDSLSYAELNARANRLAHYLQELGVKPDDRVALCVDRSLEMVVALLAVLKAGGAYVPLDPAYPPERLQFMLRDADPVALLTHSHLHNLLADMTPGLPVLLLDAPLWQDRVSDNPGPQNGLTSRHLAYVIYTSGSTGQPKGVMVEHAQIARLFSATQSWFQFAESDVWTLFHSYAFDFSVWELWGALLYGGRLIVVSMETAHSPKDFYDLVCREKVTILNHTPSAFRQLSATQAEIRQEHSLRRVIFGGEALEVSTLAPWYKQNRNQHTVLVNMYGITETTVHVTYRELEQTDTLRLNSGSPVGRRIPDLRIYILDGTGQPVPVGVSGELYIGGAGVARGYLNRAELTAERFLSDPFSDESGARMYRTGDLGRWLPDGNIEFLGRNDFQVKIRGFRIELGEIEARLREHPALRDAVVVAREDTPGDKRLIAYYTGDQTDSEELRTHLAASLPDYMVPAAYVHLDALPLTPNGKLDRRALPEPGSDAFASRDYEPPQGEIEIRLAAIWSEVLRLERIGRHDNFFALGGHSLLAVTLIERMRRSGFHVDVRAIFATPALADLAAAVDTGAPSVTVPPNLIPEDCEAVLPQMLPLIQLSAEEIDRIVAMVPGGAANVQDIYPLAPLQEGILFHHLMSGEGDPYLLAAQLSFDSRARLDDYIRALQAVIDRHDILRTAVLWEGLAEPVQVVWRRATLHIEEIALDPAAGDVAAQLYARFDPRHFRIDVRQAPLLRLYIARDTQNDGWIMLQHLHHLAGDHSTLEVLYAEVQAHLLGEPEQLPAPLPFRNLVAQARLGVSRQEHEAFFRQMLGDVDETTAPFGLLDVQGDGGGIEEARLGLDSDLGLRLRSCARRLGVSAASVCHLAWAQVLGKLSGREDVVFGTVLFGRMQGGEGADRVMGLFINTLPVRIGVGQESVEASVRRTHAVLAELLRHEHASLALAQRCSAVPAPAPLFSALLNYRHSPGAVQQPSAETVRAWEGIRMLRAEERTNYPFTLSVDDLGGEFALTAQTPVSIGPLRVCRFMHMALQSVVEALETAPATAVRTLEILPSDERHRLLCEWNDTRAEFPADKCVHQLFEEQVERSPDAVAVVFEEDSLSYAELNARANRLAHYLQELGVKPDDRVALCVDRSLEMVVALLAVLKAGGAYVPLDPAYPPERLQFMLRDADPVALLTHSHLHNLLADMTPGLPVLLLDAPLWQDRVSDNPGPQNGLTSRHLAYVIYTSGSTGQPKGVMVEHAQIARLFSATQSWFQFAESDVWTLFHSYAFDFSVWELWGALLYGGRLIVVSMETAHSPKDFYDLVCREKVTILNHTPSAFRQLSATQAEIRQEHSLRRVIFGGEALEVSTLAPWYKQNRNQHTVLVNMYGITETTVHVTYRELEQTDTLRLNSGSPVGRRIPDLRIYILDGTGQPVPVGVSGELYIGGAGVARGYLNRAELTAERFLSDPFSDESGARMYRTGDLGRWLPDGNIEFLGRNDFQVKIRGFRIELGEIEARLREHPALRDAVVVAREDTPGDKRLIAYYTGDQTDSEELRTHLAASLPDYMVPAAYVHLDALPLTPNGKLDRRALPEPGSDAFASRDYEPPQGEIEIRLAAIWSEVLRLERIGRHDNFFALGGHSLLAVTLIERMRRSGFHVDVRAIFATPALADLAAAVDTGAPSVTVPPNLIPEDCEAVLPQMLPLIQLSAEEIDRIVAMVPGGAANVQDIYPLAPLQEGILFHHLMSGEGDPYLLAAQLSFDSRARLDDYIRALQAVIDRHDILRTAVLWEGLAEPVQVVWRRATLHIEEIALDPAAGDVAAQLYARFDPRHFRIDVRQAPLLRLYIARDTQNDGWIMLQHLHHLAGDHSTLEVLYAEVQAHLLGEPEQLPAPLPFRNLVAQARLGVSRQEHEAFFRQMLGDVDETTAPFGLLDVQGDGGGIEEARLGLDSDLGLRLRSCARRLGVSAASVCHLAWAQVLGKLSGREDVVFGTVLFGRMQGGEGADRVMGLFINTLPVRIGVGQESVEASVRRTHAVLAELLRHEHASLALAQRCSAVPAPAPLFSALLNYRHSPGAVQQPSAETVRAWEGIRMLRAEERTNYPFTLSVDDLGGEFALTAQTPVSIGPLRVCRFMHMALQSVVEALETAPATAVRTLEILPSDERHRLLCEWNDTRAEFPADKCVHQLFEEQVERSPDAVAVVFEEDSLSYAELNARANRLAHYLQELGVKPDDRVALCVDRSLEMVVALLAVLKAGGAYVPLDPAYPPERLQFMLRDADPVALLTHSHLHNLLADMTPGLPVLLLDAPLWQDRVSDNPGPQNGLTSRHLAYVIYTSGSTGQPKGVMVEHRGVVNRMLWMQAAYRLGSDDVVLQKTPYTFDVSVWEFFWPLLVGTRLVIARPEGHKDPSYLVQICQAQKITTAHFVPSMLSAFLGNASSPQLPSLARIVCSGEALPLAILQKFGQQLSQVVLHNLYGPTEAAVDVTAWSCPPDFNSAVVPIGRPISNTRIYILDGTGQPVPVGVSGELYIGGVQVARGYLNRAELTAERFLSDPFSDESGARMYRTGDLGRWLPDGNIEFLGRNDFQVKIRGFRIELGEIEARLREHPALRDAVVVAREDTPGDKRLIAYYTGDQTDSEELRTHLAASLPDYMVPAAYVHLDALPLTPNGKLDRRALPEPGSDAFASRDYEPPQGEIEIRLAAIWSEVLRLERIGRHDNFFALGGHSLLAVRMTTRMRQALDIEVPIRDLFAHPTLADLARTLANATPAQLPVITPVMRGERIPLSFAQQRLWFLSQMEGVSEAYHIPLGLRLSGTLDRIALHRALDQILTRHEVLRTTFAFVDGEPVQRIATAQGTHFLLIEHDLSRHGDHDKELDRLIALEATSSFDLEAGPLIRGRLIRMNEDEHALLITMHHIVSDGWSMGIFTSELSTLYAAFREGKPDPLAELDIQYADYAVWQRQWIEGDILRQQAEYWKTTLNGAPALLELPADHPRPAQQDFAGAFVELILDQQLTIALKELSRQHGCTLFMTLLTAWAVLLARLSGQQDLIIGTPTANRGRSEIENLIGFFVNTLALRIDLSGSPSTGQLLERVKAQTLAAQQHQDIPFEQVVELAQPVRSLAHNPLVQIMFAWQNADNDSRLELPGLELAALPPSPHRVAKFDLTLSLMETGNSIAGGVEYATSLFDQATIERYLGYFRTLLEAMVADDTQAVDRLTILDEAERHQLLYGWNDTRTEFPADKCVHQLFEEQVERSPDAVAVVFEEDSLSYAELNARANRLAHYLQELGVKPDDRVALCVDRSLEMVVALLAVLKAGGAYVPLDPAYPPERLQFMLRDADPVALLTHSHLHNLLADMTPGLPVLLLDAPLWQDRVSDNPGPQNGLTSRHLAYVIYTSGSTGQPKGVMVEHAQIARLFSATQSWFQFAESDVWTLFHSYAFDFSVWELWGALLYGGRLIVVSMETAHSPKDFYDLVCREKVTILNHTPSAFRQLSATQAEIRQEHSLRRVIFGGEALEVSTLAPWYKQNRNQHTVLVNMYGITETTVHVTYRELEQTDTLRLNSGSPVGRRIPDLRIYILDGTGQPVPVGVSGELYIGGAGVARGYLNRAELTAERFLSDPFSDESGARMYRTGDLGRWLPDGNIEFLGRNDFQVKIRGFRIELGEIEARLREHPALRDAVVVAREDTPGDKRLIAYYTGDQTDSEELRTHLAASLPDYMVPAAYVHLDALPLTPNGKLDRRALPEPGSDAFASRDYEPPQGEIEIRLAAIWSEVLRLERIGRHDNFFALGGHSLLAVRMTALLEQSGINVQIAHIFMNPTIRALAKTARPRRSTDPGNEALAFREGGTEPPLFFTHCGNGELMYIPTLASYIDPNIPIYGLPPLPADKLQLRTIEAMAARMVNMIRSIQPNGPYRIAGWSFGGLLAYEVATQLIGADQVVSFLGLVDTHYPRGNGDAPLDDVDDYNPKRMLIDYVHGTTSDPSLARDFEAVRSNLDKTKFSELVGICNKRRLLPDFLMDMAPAQLENWIARSKIFEVASRHYSAQQPPMPVHLFVARNSDSTNPETSWASTIPAPLLRTFSLSATHHTIVMKPDVTELASIITRAINTLDQHLPDTHAQPFFVLRGSSESTAIPIFCIPGAGDNVTTFMDLTECISQRSIFGLQPRGMNGDFIPHSTVTAAADSHLDAVLTTVPNGPLILLGHSFGGWIAFEMARKLSNLGRDVSSLILIDSDPPDIEGGPIREYNRTEAIMEMIDAFEELKGHRLGIERPDLEVLGDAAQLRLLHESLVRAELLPRRSHPEILKGPFSVFSASLRTRYVPATTYEGRVQLILASDDRAGRSVNAQNHVDTETAWRRFAPKLHSSIAGGNHMTLLKRPWVTKLVDILEIH